RSQRLEKLPYIIEDEERGIQLAGPEILYPMYDGAAKRREQGMKLAQAYTGGTLIQLSSPDDRQLWAYSVEGFDEQRKKAKPGTLGPLTLDKDAVAELRRQTGVETDTEEEPTLDAAIENIEAGGNPFLEALHLYSGAQQTLSHYLDNCFYWNG